MPKAGSSGLVARPPEQLPLNDSACVYLKHRGLTEREIRRLKPFLPKGYPAYVAFPAGDSWHGRFMGSDAVRGARPRWRSPAGVRDLVWGDDKLLPGLPVYVCEGIFDAVYFGRQGVATLGWDVSEGQAAKVLAREPGKVILAFDLALPESCWYNAQACFERLNRRTPVEMLIPPEDVPDWGTLVQAGRRHRDRSPGFRVVVAP